ncbi:UPF0280 family protein [Rhizobium sp. CSW-27]|uniref:UPF0280 family protein n=1 Tax=Rhizobium sp. CSW-27 TaxID=2839985 RepID=UPI001C022E47|nr:UPF0280 family protein [Rhizobium sp. CSW-27]MBT9369639.1 UPF0280 family protein [Rhizobium sp. CSW-27]
MAPAHAAYLDGHADGRLHLQHGPIDLVIGVDGGSSPEIERSVRAKAFAAAHRRFRTILTELVCELPLLKSPVQPGSTAPQGAVARRMMAAVRPFAADHFITPMAAVAGAVADEVLAAMLGELPANDLPLRIYVNNGGDIALHLAGDRPFRVGMAHEAGPALGDLSIGAADPVRGIATSGRGGRSLSMGIADSVTILARTAAQADAAATIVANAVDLPGHPAVQRRPARCVVDDSDLGEQLVVTAVGCLSVGDAAQALEDGARMARRLQERDLLHSAALFLDRASCIVDALPLPSALLPETRHHA